MAQLKGVDCSFSYTVMTNTHADIEVFYICTQTVHVLGITRTQTIAEN